MEFLNLACETWVSWTNCLLVLAVRKPNLGLLVLSVDSVVDLFYPDSSAETTYLLTASSCDSFLCLPCLTSNCIFVKYLGNCMYICVLYIHTNFIWADLLTTSVFKYSRNFSKLNFHGIINYLSIFAEVFQFPYAIHVKLFHVPFV